MTQRDRYVRPITTDCLRMSTQAADAVTMCSDTPLALRRALRQHLCSLDAGFGWLFWARQCTDWWPAHNNWKMQRWWLPPATRKRAL